MTSTEQLEVLDGQTTIEELLDEPVLGLPAADVPLQRCLPGLEGLA